MGHQRHSQLTRARAVYLRRRSGLRDHDQVAKQANRPPPEGVIDITGLYSAPNDVVSALRLMTLMILWIAVSGVWFGVCIWPVRQAEMGPALAVLMVVGAVPLVFGIYWIFRHYSGTMTGLGRPISAGEFTPEELARIVPGVGFTIGQLLSQVEGFARGLGAAVEVRGSGKQVARASAIRLGGAAMLVLAVVVGVNSGGGLNIGMLVLIAGGLFAFVRAGKTVQPTLQKVLEADARKPVLLLRSFGDDASLPVSRPQKSPVGNLMFRRRLEQGIAGALKTFGPLIAIGKPGEPLPEIGAARAYLDDNEWQPAVLRWIEQALFIVMMAGATTWITWELHRIVELGRAHHLFVVVPPGDNGKRWQHIDKSLESTRWYPGVAALDPKGLLLVRLRSDGRVCAIRKNGRMVEQDYQLALAISVYDEFCRQGGAGSRP